MMGLLALSFSSNTSSVPAILEASVITELWNHLLYLDQAFWSSDPLLMVM